MRGLSCRVIQIQVILFLLISSIWAQSLQDALLNVFNEILKPTDDGGHLVLTGPSGVHGRHFIPASVEASNATIQAFSNFLSANISSFPLSSTTAGLTFDFSSGAPVSTTTSLGPIFSERAQTLGSQRLNIGFNFSYLDLNKLRGTDTDKIRFSFFHDDFAGPNDIPPNLKPDGVIGDDPFGTEFDHIDLYMNTKITASILAFHFSYGITDRLDINVAVPFVTVSLKGNPVARMNPLSALAGGARGDTVAANPVHFWTDNGSDTLLTFTPTPLRDDAAGVGDIAVRLKYNFLRGQTIDMAALVEYRFASGAKEDFLGAGGPSYKGQLIFSSIMGDFAPHLNLGYQKSGNKNDRDEINLNVGYDQKLSNKLTLALDFLGEFEVGNKNKVAKFPEPFTLQGGGPWANFVQVVSATNIPNLPNDNIMNGSLGFKFTPKENLMVIANGIVPLNDGGLRSDFIPTFGFEFSF